MKNRRNYYRILHVQPDAPTEVIHSSYRTLMMRLKMHPDLGGDEWNAALLNEAFATLGNPAKRAVYDRFIQTLRAAHEALLSSPAVAAEQVASPEPAVDPETTDGVVCAFCGAANGAPNAESSESQCYHCSSPLIPISTVEGSSTTKRLLERMPRQLHVTCVEASRPHQSFEGTTEDVSLSGMRLITRAELSPGQRLKIQCSFADAVGVVVHVTAASSTWQRRWRAGIRFLTLRAKQIRGVFLSTEG